jgi:hypothetical protein
MAEIALKVTYWGETFVNDFAVLLIGLLLFGSEDTELARESMAVGIESATALAFWGFGACGMVGALVLVGLVSGHIRFPLQIKMPAVDSRLVEGISPLTNKYHEECENRAGESGRVDVSDCGEVN